ncbi:unnamed protein product [Agarophyton chilense]|eukprot:gb/GEZJ01002295.1/.p1 GENE.gb/GEZJ01002295.1/~~gb/GEZJ01002295.1/.p1  ORF type:complete len:1174 (+),score=198.82 gb/GEZJ01002295.1/:190-3711(+)
MEDTEISVAKRKQPEDPQGLSQQPSNKRQRQKGRDDSESYGTDIEDNALILAEPEVKKVLLEEANLLRIPRFFEQADPDSEKQLPVCSTKYSLQRFLDYSETHQISTVAEIDSGIKNAELPVLSDEVLKPADIIDVDKEETTPVPGENIPPTAPNQFFHYRPMTWPYQEDQDLDHKHMTRKSAAQNRAHRVDEERTCSWLDPCEKQQLGSLWSRVRQDSLKELLTDPRFLLRSAQVERDDFLKACMRLQHIAHPVRLSDLLGNASRPKAYCKFLLNFILDLYNSKEIRTRIDPKQLCFKRYPDLDVYGDGKYADIDFIIRRLDYIQMKKEEEKEEGRDESQSCKLKSDTYREEVIHLSDQRLDEESDEEEPEVSGFLSQRLHHQDAEMDQFCDLASYIMRSYMYNVSGETFCSVDEFATYCQQQGISFMDSEQSVVGHRLGRLKWTNEPVLAPALGKSKTIQEPLRLWQHAINTSPVKNLARFALIQTEALLDWLEYVTRIKNNPKTLEEFYASERPVMCFAPVALLYLADFAAGFALEVLQAAIQIVETDEFYGDIDKAENESAREPLRDNADDRKEAATAEDMENDEESLTLIESWDIRKAFSEKLMSRGKASFCFLSHVLPNEAPADGSYNPHWSEAEWPQRKIRPYTESQTFELCSRVPVSKVIVPHGAMVETRAIMMGLKSIYQMDLYTKPSEKPNTFSFRRRLLRSLSADEAARHKKEGVETWSAILKKFGPVSLPTSKDRNLIRGREGDGAQVTAHLPKTGKPNSKEENLIHDNDISMTVVLPHACNPKPEDKNLLHDGDISMTDAAPLAGTSVSAKLCKSTTGTREAYLNISEKDKTVSHSIATPNMLMAENIGYKDSACQHQELGSISQGSNARVHADESEGEAAMNNQADVKSVTDEKKSHFKKPQVVPGNVVNNYDGDIEQQKEFNGTHMAGDIVLGKHSNGNSANNSHGVAESKNEFKEKHSINSNEAVAKESAQQQASFSEKYAEFFGVMNPAEVIIAKFGINEWREISRGGLKAIRAAVEGKVMVREEEGSEISNEDQGGGKKDILRRRASSICYNRLRWIVFHAMGINLNEELKAEKPLGYASTANYTNFKQLRSRRPLALSESGFEMLAQLTEQIVRDEAEILMECAAHDDGRPWVDRADVALIHAVRKKSFPYEYL